MKLGWVVTCTTHCPVQFFLLLSKLFVWPFSQFGPCYWLITFQVHEVRRLQPHLHKVGLNWSKSWANDGLKTRPVKKLKKGLIFNFSQFLTIFDQFSQFLLDRFHALFNWLNWPTQSGLVQFLKQCKLPLVHLDSGSSYGIHRTHYTTSNKPMQLLLLLFKPA